MRISTLILAAGSSSRLGSPKQLVEYQGEILISKITHLALRVCNNVLVILGANETLILPKLDKLCQGNQQNLKIMVNTHWNEGIGKSISVGVNAIAKESDAILILLCDQPFVDEVLLREMLQVFADSGKSIIACRYANQFGVPILFDKKYFEELIKLSGDKGAKLILNNHLDEIVSVDFPAGIFDIDTQEDINKILKRI